MMLMLETGKRREWAADVGIADDGVMVWMDLRPPQRSGPPQS